MGRHWAAIKGHDRFETNKVPRWEKAFRRETWAETVQYFFMAQVTYKAAINLVKCCILLLYLRLFHVVR